MTPLKKIRDRMEDIYGDFQRLPEGCISHVLSLTSPRDSCRSAAASTAFRSAVDSDSVWERFLPSDYLEILDRAVERIHWTSKRDLFFRLCNPILIDGGKMSLALDKSSGAKCLMVSARNLWIVWGDTPQYWSWISKNNDDCSSSHDSRFSEVAHMNKVCWLKIHGRIHARLLSPKTNYTVHFIYKLDPASRGLDHSPYEASVKLGAYEMNRALELQPGRSERLEWFRQLWLRRFVYGTAASAGGAQEEEDGKHNVGPSSRGDGWMEIEMGDFYNEEGEDGEIEIRLVEVKGGHWKSGLTVMGIEVRPKIKRT